MKQESRIAVSGYTIQLTDQENNSVVLVFSGCGAAIKFATALLQSGTLLELETVSEGELD